MKRLCYRGVFYDYPQFSASEAHPIIHCTSLRAGQQDEIVHNKAQFNVNEVEVSDWSQVMQCERMGSLYRLYCAGWRNGSTQRFSPLSHYLLSMFLYYRRGFVEGLNWQQEQMKSRTF
ncbi:hypothetical protein [Leptolyngbya sp. NIES-2104]|uniref:hypothetical protein n=1 Tax=Leptolyngbya sp. NIES-2104 TaxID=1552121 RepID=UPI0006EC5DB1|nr:hypothetical protein [Leptolyngbya sp. NIES-2104]GAP94264.1 hypothetical protein NIES2104_07750 [Leptolyngbya sp. NIES-2104]